MAIGLEPGALLVDGDELEAVQLVARAEKAAVDQGFGAVAAYHHGDESMALVKSDRGVIDDSGFFGCPAGLGGKCIASGVEIEVVLPGQGIEMVGDLLLVGRRCLLGRSR